MANIGNIAIATIGWYSSVAADTPGSIPDGEEIHCLGWTDGTIAPSITTHVWRNQTSQYWSIIPRRKKWHR